MDACVADPSSPSVAISGGRLGFAATPPAAATEPGLHVFRGDARATLYLPVSAGGRSAPFLILLAPDANDETWDAVAEIGRGRPPAFGRDPIRIDAAIG